MINGYYADTFGEPSTNDDDDVFDNFGDHVWDDDIDFFEGEEHS